MVADELLGEAKVSIVRFFDGEVRTERVPLLYNNQANVAGEIFVEVQ